MKIRKLLIAAWVLGIFTLLGACSAKTTSSDRLAGLAGRGYSGRLVLIQPDRKGNKVIELDLATGTFKTLFQSPENGWLTGAVVSPDGQQILLAYALPPAPGESQNYSTDLYLMPYDGSSEPHLLQARQERATQSYFNPAWAPDGQSVYVTFLYQTGPTADNPSPYQNDILQITLTGEAKVLIHQHALWPSLSPDGKKMAYLFVDPITSGNDLYQANSDGSQPAPLLQPGPNTPIDDHLFSADGSQMIFSMVNAKQSLRHPWFERLFAVEIASAHNIPSDWYTIPTAGGQPERLTEMNNTGMYADLSPDGRQLAFISAAGLYIMNLDGSELFSLSDQIFIGTIDWIR